MQDNELEYENPNDIEDILYSMNNEEFSKDELEDQLGESIFSSYKTNYLESYLEKYKFYKEEFEENQEFLDSLKQSKDQLILDIIDIISEKFCFEVDDESKTKKVAKAIYNFFVIDYKENLETFFFNFIEKNKKMIITDIKQRKRKKDISTVANKMKFNNNDALIIDNIVYIMTELIPSISEDNFLDYILDDDDTMTNIAIRKFIEKEKISLTEDSYSAFLDAFIGEEDGWTEIISDIVSKYVQNANELDIDIFE